MQTPTETPVNSPIPAPAGETPNVETIKRERLSAKFVMLVFGIIVLNHWLTAELLGLLQSVPKLERAAPWLLLAAGIIGFLLAAHFLHRGRHEHHERTLQAAWLVVLALAGGDLCGLTIHELTHTSNASLLREAAAFAIGFPALAWIVVQLRRWKHEWSRLVTRSRKLSREQAKEKPVEQLVLFVSPPQIIPEITEASSGHQVNFPATGSAPVTGTDPVTLCGDLDKDIEKMSKLRGHNWQQLLRAIAPHRQNLADVYLVGSPDTTGMCKAPRPPGQRAEFTEGSHLYLPLCQQFIQHYLPNAKVHMTEAVDFEDSEKLEPFLHTLQTSAVRKSGSHRFAIDVTGGQKTNSIVAAGVTLLSGSAVQYVQTAPRSSNAGTNAGSKPTIEAYLYDLRLDLPPDTP